VRSETPRLPLRVLRLTSAFEAPAAVHAGRGRRFAPIGGIHNHTGCLTRALDGRGLRQHVVTARPPGAPRREPLGRAALVHRLGAPVPAARQGWAWPAAAAASRLAPGVDLIHAHQGEDLATLPVAVTVARRHRLALVVTVHASLRHTVTARGLRARGLKEAGGRV
jgi:hypothetical protein